MFGVVNFAGNLVEEFLHFDPDAERDDPKNPYKIMHARFSGNTLTFVQVS